ncbi:MAG: enoyl-CoA hydratase [Desulfobacterales bacterium SG8_35_2]|nr:MAG: enoyl-CoA hydratase [Desulfobacterales bacterium SG8_35_2]
MAYNNINFLIEDGVGIITLNRPEVLNSFNREMGKEVQGAFSRAGENAEIRAILLTGEGRAFCAGQDLEEAAPPNGSPPPEIGLIVRQTYNPIIRFIRNIEKPVVCAVNGVAAGAGANIALACDFVITSEKATFIQAFCKIGLIPDSGGTYFLPRLVGIPRAAAMMMLGDKINAQEALEMGLIHNVFPEEIFRDESLKFAKYLATKPTKGLGLIKKALNQSLSNDLETQLELEAKLQSEAGATVDSKEGIQAFLEKRIPKFIGR